MTRQEITDRVARTIHKQLGIAVEHIHLSSTLQGDLEMDSLDIWETSALIEEAFHVYVPDNVTEDLVTVQDIVNHVEQAHARNRN